jgi:plastocyanin
MRFIGGLRLAFLSLGTMAILGVLGLVASGEFGSSATTASAAAQESRNLTVLVGAGQDTVSIDTFFPQNVRIRAGDTVTWRIESDATHAVGFNQGATPSGPLNPDVFAAPGEVIPAANVPVPGRPGVTMLNPVRDFPVGDATAPYRGNNFISSGRLAKDRDFWGVPVPDTFSLTFDTPGTYQYLCLVHTGAMYGTVEVVDASAASVPSQAEIDALAQSEMASLLGRVEQARAQGSNPRNDPGPNGSHFWYVRPGNTEQGVNERRVQLLEFLPSDLTITAGDTVIWPSLVLHSVTFTPSPPPPAFIMPEDRPEGPPWMIRNPLIVDPAKPTGVYDPALYYNSGGLNPPSPTGTAWALTFETPGTFEYICGVHQELGMKGRITVLPRES